MHSRLSNDIKAEASRLGFYACGIARAESVHDDDARAVMRWLDANGHADMEYMGRNLDKRLNPELLMPGVKSIVCVAMNYTPAKRIPEDEYQFAAYAYGKDYHDIVKQKLHQLALFVEQSIPDATLPLTYRCFCDSAPVLERYWAVKAGIGWIGRNHQLIIPKAGSMFVLGELFLNIELECDSPIKNGCGDCHKCLDVCPTKVLSLQSFDASKCLSYQLIENRQGLSEEAKTHMENVIYGCDRCQQACPWNRFAPPTDIPDLLPSDEFLCMTKERWESLTVEDYRRLFKGSAVKRVKYEGLMRNIRAAMEKGK